MTHPGELIRDEIKARGITQKRLSELSGISPSILSETIKGRRSISLNMAFGLEKSLEIPAEMWLNLQSQYDLDVAEANSREPKSRFTTANTAIDISSITIRGNVRFILFTFLLFYFSKR